VVIETADSFILHRRPDLPGKLSYPGKLHFIGGHEEEGEDGMRAAARELEEEVGLKLPERAISGYAVREFEGTGKDNEPVSRRVTVGYLALTKYGEEQLRLSEAEGGELVRISKDYDEFASLEDEFAPFAKEILSQFIKKDIA
jgi:8-oxo-dGTP pyrophosphatase MutT (NUDIX family)